MIKRRRINLFSLFHAFIALLDANREAKDHIGTVLL